MGRRDQCASRTGQDEDERESPEHEPIILKVSDARRFCDFRWTGLVKMDIMKRDWGQPVVQNEGRAMTERTLGFGMGLLVGVVLTVGGAAAGWWSPVFGMQAGPPKPTYKIVLENERVRVRDVTFPPGVLDTPMHTHEYAHVGVILTKGSLVFTDPAGKVETVAFDSGSVGFREAKATHRVGNPGPEPMRVIEVELK